MDIAGPAIGLLLLGFFRWGGDGEKAVIAPVKDFFKETFKPN